MIGVREALDEDLAKAFLLLRMARQRQRERDDGAAREAVAKAWGEMDALLDWMLELRGR